MPTDNNDRLFLNPRMDIETRNAFEKNLLKAKQSGIKVDKSKLIRAFVQVFNQNPDKMLKLLELKQ